MELSSLAAADRRTLETALRDGQSVALRLDQLPRDRPADELVPLVDRLHCRDAGLDRSLRPLLAPPARAGRRHRVTAVIPCSRGTPLGLAALRAQDCVLDVLVLANGDVPAQGDRVLQVPWEGHGTTRQRGVEAASGDYVLFTVDDALPRGAGVVSTLVEALGKRLCDLLQLRRRSSVALVTLGELFGLDHAAGVVRDGEGGCLAAEHCCASWNVPH